MLTPADLADSSLLSGYKHVGFDRKAKVKPYHAQAYGGKNDKAGHAWQGPARATALEAAQDYCDYANTKPLLTIDDLRNPARKSGFDHIGYRDQGDRTGPKPYQAQSYAGGHPAHPGKGMGWVGPRRATAEEAAQDYCDYVNSQRGATPATPIKRKTAGHTGKRDPLPVTDPEVQAALGILRDAKGAREGRQGYVYLIAEDRPGGGIRYVKIGFSTNPQARVAELQTGNPRPLRLLSAKPGTVEDERRLHDKYSDKNVLQEWFEATADILLEFPAKGATA